MTKPIKVLNLYACLGGNRLLWDTLANIEVTAVELDLELVRLYKERFPDDQVVQADAHDYLLKNYSHFDFIWSSPPCPTHSRARFWGVGKNGRDPVYPDMRLYAEILLLKHHFDGYFVVENVKPYYRPLLNPVNIGRHLYWSNFNIDGYTPEQSPAGKHVKNEVRKLCDFHNYDFYKYKCTQRRRKIARNLVPFLEGEHIFKCYLNYMNR